MCVGVCGCVGRVLSAAGTQGQRARRYICRWANGATRLVHAEETGKKKVTYALSCMEIGRHWHVNGNLFGFKTP